MKYIVCALAMLIVAGSSCKSNSEETKPIPDISKELPIPPKPAPETNPTKPSEEHHHNSGKCGECEKCHHHKHKRIPPGHAKKMHGEQSARNYAPGHHKKH